MQTTLSYYTDGWRNLTYASPPCTTLGHATSVAGAVQCDPSPATRFSRVLHVTDEDRALVTGLRYTSHPNTQSPLCHMISIHISNPVRQDARAGITEPPKCPGDGTARSRLQDKITRSRVQIVLVCHGLGTQPQCNTHALGSSFLEGWCKSRGTPEKVRRD